MLSRSLLERGLKSLPKLTQKCKVLAGLRPESTVPKVDPEGRQNCNVGTIGHIDHGKTTLTSAITKVLEKDGLADYVPYDAIDRTREEKARGITVNASHIGYSTHLRSYAHTDCPGHADYIRNMISGTSQMDCAIVVVAATDGPMPQTKEHILLAKQIGIERLVVFINKADAVDPEVLELVEIEMRELLCYYGYNGNDIPFVVGSALLAIKGDSSEHGVPSIKKLLNILDSHIPTPIRDLTSPFLMPIDNTFNLQGRGTIVVGTIQKGIANKNDTAFLMGYDSKLKTSIADLQIFKKSVEKAEAGENVGMLLRGIRIKDIQRGMVISAPNGDPLSNYYKAEFYLLSISEGGRKKPIGQTGYIQQLFSTTWDIMCRVDLCGGKEMLLPGDYGSVKLTLLQSMVFPIGQTFTIRENNVIVGTGKITAVLPPVIVQRGDLKNVNYEAKFVK